VARIHELLGQLRSTNPTLADDISREYDLVSDRRAFGLNFERHTPEAVELPGRRIRVGDKVRLLPSRGEAGKSVNGVLHRVTGIERSGANRIAKLSPVSEPGPGVEPAETASASIEDLVVVAEFRDPIYPGLVSNGRVERGGDKPYHSVINGENYHVMQALLFTHRGKVDAIYIDPPYNTGAKDWKYNNDYVEADDIYRHSKWLAFMERRLLLAKELLNPDDSVLIVTIDEKEYLRLGLLLEQIFPEAKMQMISTVIKPGGTSRTKEFSRVEEYYYFLFFGAAELARTEDNMLFQNAVASEGLAESDLWEGMVRRGIGVVRSQRPKQFYPIYVDPDGKRIMGRGEPLALSANRGSVNVPKGRVAVWPIKDDGTEGFWQLSPEGLLKAQERGTVRVGSFNAKTGQWRIQYMKAKKAKAIADGQVATLGKNEHGVVILDLANSSLNTDSTPRTVWNKTSHDASTGGAGLLNRLLPDRKFPFAKSLFAVEDSLRFFVGAKPAAVVLDFFSGSGTTAHAVMRLNKQDGGRRISISVTNNEVSADEQKGLREEGCRPGDAQWEQWGICDYITKPRIRAAITGVTSSGAPIKGDYKFTDEFPMEDGFEENVEFFTLTYEAPMRVQSNREFSRIAPFLWLRAESRGNRLESLPEGWGVADTYGVLADLDRTDEFIAAMVANPDAKLAFIVTDEDRLFEAVVRDLSENVEPVRMYEAYLRNFEIDAMRSVR
jgi:adenine-specific DNA-methyltransferase